MTRSGTDSTHGVDERALWRFSVIAPMLHRAHGTSLNHIAWQLSAEIKRHADGTAHKLSPATLLRWFRCYQERGLEALNFKRRNDCAISRALDQTAITLLLKLAQAHADWTIKAIHSHAQLSLARDISIKAVYRLFQGRRHVPKTCRSAIKWSVRPLTEGDMPVLDAWRKSKDKRLWEKAVAILDNGRLSLEQIASKIENQAKIVPRSGTS